MTTLEGARGPRNAGRLPAVELLTLAAVALVVLLVSLPCLRDFAVRENQRDAQSLLSKLASIVTLAAARDPAAPIDLASLLAARPALAQRLPDAEVGPDALLRHHGYLFAARRDPTGGVALCAWPLDHGRTGLHAYLYLAGRGLYAHPNGGRWSGEVEPAPSELVPSVGWVALGP
jgi:hypothetical protein